MKEISGISKGHKEFWRGNLTLFSSGPKMIRNDVEGISNLIS